jgi:ribosomal protein S27E
LEQLMDIVEQFTFVYCNSCKKVQMIFEVMKSNNISDHDAADIICDECKSVIATLHARTKQ